MDAEQTAPTDNAHRKRALLLGGALAAAVIAWNWGDWFGDGDSHGVSIEIGETEEAAEVVEREMTAIGRGEQGADIAERIRGAGRDEEAAQAETPAAPAAAAEGRARSEASAPVAATETGDAAAEEEAETGLMM